MSGKNFPEGRNLSEECQKLLQSPHWAEGFFYAHEVSIVGKSTRRPRVDVVPIWVKAQWSDWGFPAAVISASHPAPLGIDDPAQWCFYEELDRWIVGEGVDRFVFGNCESGPRTSEDMILVLAERRADRTCEIAATVEEDGIYLPVAGNPRLTMRVDDPRTLRAFLGQGAQSHWNEILEGGDVWRSCCDVVERYLSGRCGPCQCCGCEEVQGSLSFENCGPSASRVDFTVACSIHRGTCLSCSRAVYPTSCLERQTRSKLRFERILKWIEGKV